MGIAAGRVSGIVVIDVDAKSDGPATLSKLKELNGDLPRTVISRTGGGGFHLLFAYPDSGVVGSSIGKWPGIDVRGDGGYIVAPPSTHASGDAYVWAEGFGPDDVPIAPLPGWMRHQLSAPDPQDRTPRSASEWSLMLRDVAEGTRNQTLSRLAGKLFREHTPSFWPGVVELIHAFNEARCKPPLPFEEVERTIESIATREAAKLEAQRQTSAAYQRIAGRRS